MVNPGSAERMQQLALTTLRHLLSSYSGICSTYTYTDVVFVIVEDRKRPGQGQEMAAHKIVMGMGCDAFKETGVYIIL